jgi:hypothetical protein
MNKALCITWLLCSAGLVHADTTDKDIRNLLEITTDKVAIKQMAVNMIGYYQKNHPEVPSITWSKILEETTLQSYFDALVPVYENNFTHDEIKSLIAFYKSPLGQKFIQKQPIVSKETMGCMRKWMGDTKDRILKNISPTPSGP